MVEINNQCKASLDMLAWSEELITDVRNQKSVQDVSCRRRAIYRLLRSNLRKLVTLNPKLKSTGAGRYQLLPLVGCLPQAVTERLPLRKVRTLWHCSRLRSVALYLWLIVVISVRAIDRCSNIWASLLPVTLPEHKADSLIAKSKEAGVNGFAYVWAESPRLSPLWLSASSSACRGLLIITVITPLPTKPSATKMPENWKLANAAITDMQMRQRMLSAPPMQNTRRS